MSALLIVPTACKIRPETLALKPGDLNALAPVPQAPAFRRDHEECNQRPAQNPTFRPEVARAFHGGKCSP